MAKKRSGKYSKTKGNAYELKIIKELTEMGYKGLKSSRSESKNLDDAKIDIAETEDRMPMYIQCKKTQSTPSVTDNIKNCPRKDRPLVIIWSKEVKKEKNICSDGEYAIMTKKFFYELLKQYNNGICVHTD